MVPREKINEKVAEIMNQNGLNKCFQPVVEEFFYRVVDQCNWNERNLEIAFERFSKVCDIGFENCWERNFLKVKKENARSL